MAETNNNGKIIGFTESHENHFILDAFFEQAGAGILIKTLDDNFIRINQKYCDILGYSEEELMGFKNLSKITHPDDVGLYHDYVKENHDGKPVNYVYEKRYIHKNGSIIWVLQSVSIITDENGNPVQQVVIVQDITEQKKAQKDLQESNEELQRFAYVASHDLQEPLRMVGSYLQLLERRYGDRLDGDAREFMDFAIDGAERMKILINDLLDYSRVESRGKPFELTDLNIILNRVQRTLSLTIEDSGAQVIVGELPEVKVDEEQITQLFQNLIGNAIKFHKKDEKPVIRISVQKKSPQFWEFSISDNGIGIAPEYFERIFVIFQRLHTKDEYPGTGIGLAICKRIVERHGGKIWLNSKPGEGTTFYFTLPA